MAVGSVVDVGAVVAVTVRVDVGDASGTWSVAGVAWTAATGDGVSVAAGVSIRAGVDVAPASTSGVGEDVVSTSHAAAKANRVSRTPGTILRSTAASK